MKNLLKLLLLFAATSILFASCKTASITKRHYTKGYYVSHSGKKGKNSPATTEKTLPGTNAESLTAKESRPESTDSQNEKSLAMTPPATGTQPLIKSEKSTTKKEIITDDADNEITLAEPSVKQMVINPFKLAKVAAARDSGDDALSLIWLLIVVLLIIYIAGLLLDNFGLGGIIHILGVIILVLLVLWLLHII
jgi:hypothetical protein